MRFLTGVALAAVMLWVPAAISAQGPGAGVAGVVGTLGFGVEGALGFNDRWSVRGGIGYLPLEIDLPEVLNPGFSEGTSATLRLPDRWSKVGVDFYLGSSFRIGGGMLFKPDHPMITGTLTGSALIDIGGETYGVEDVTEITGILASKASAPYVLIGFGKHTSSGIGFFLDLGVALLGEANVQLTAAGNSSLINSSDFQGRLRTEEQSLQDSAGNYLKYWPILNFGMRVGIGG